MKRGYILLYLVFVLFLLASILLAIHQVQQNQRQLIGLFIQDQQEKLIKFSLKKAGITPPALLVVTNDMHESIEIK